MAESQFSKQDKLADSKMQSPSIAHAVECCVTILETSRNATALDSMQASPAGLEGSAMGASAPGSVVLERFGYNPDYVAARARALLGLADPPPPPEGEA